MNFDGIGLHPDNAIKIVLDRYDHIENEENKIKFLLENRPVKINSNEIPSNFSSGNLIDINANELIGLGIICNYYNWCGEPSHNTYQAFVGVEDSARQQTENILSDGAIWHDQEKKKMVVQQAMVQGYFPKKEINDDDLILKIKKKSGRRSDYPNICALIINVFGESIKIDAKKIYNQAKKEISLFDDVFIIEYQLPKLKLAEVIYLSEPDAPRLTINLKRYPSDNNWKLSNILI